MRYVQVKDVPEVVFEPRVGDGPSSRLISLCNQMG